MTSAWAPVLAQACPTTSTPIHVAAGHLICASRLARATCPVNTCTSGTCQVAPTEAAIIRHFGPSPRRRSSERCHVDRAVTSKRLLLGSFQRPSFGSRQLRELSRLPSDGKATDLSGSDGRRSQAGRNGGSGGGVPTGAAFPRAGHTFLRSVCRHIHRIAAGPPRPKQA